METYIGLKNEFLRKLVEEKEIDNKTLAFLSNDNPSICKKIVEEFKKRDFCTAIEIDGGIGYAKIQIKKPALIFYNNGGFR